jgi:hypothetical protein|tara:strand:+ start:146 stop:343 length:198 start_codon:yes stop_codon:yes gene_type:complete
MAALRETHKSALLAHAEAREKTLAGIAAVERRLAKVGARTPSNVPSPPNPARRRVYLAGEALHRE